MHQSHFIRLHQDKSSKARGVVWLVHCACTHFPRQYACQLIGLTKFEVGKRRYVIGSIIAVHLENSIYIVTTIGRVIAGRPLFPQIFSPYLTFNISTSIVLSGRQGFPSVSLLVEYRLRHPRWATVVP